MNDQSKNLNKIQLGIEAARAGRNTEAIAHLKAVLERDNDNVPAMFWLAFVSASPKESINLLKQILTLEPNNERAKAGIRWASERLAMGTSHVVPRNNNNKKPQIATIPPKAKDNSGANKKKSRDHFLSDDIQKKAKKGVLAHRARRTIDSSLTVFLFALFLLGIIIIELGTLSFWSTNSSQAVSADVMPVYNPDITSTYEVNTVISETSKISPSVETNITIVDSNLATPLKAALTIPFPIANIVTPIEPNIFIGPKLPTDTPPEIVQSVESATQAYQATAGEKWIEVNVTTQQVTAWEGNLSLFSFISSTGLPNTPTVLGQFNIYWKLEATLMTGDDYYLPDVPYTMYFYSGYALHGTYWHNNFGQPMSHGCVNLSIDDSKRLFEWADPIIPPGQTQVTSTASNPGTLVVVHQ